MIQELENVIQWRRRIVEVGIIKAACESLPDQTTEVIKARKLSLFSKLGEPLFWMTLNVLILVNNQGSILLILGGFFCFFFWVHHIIKFPFWKEIYVPIKEGEKVKEKDIKLLLKKTENEEKQLISQKVEACVRILIERNRSEILPKEYAGLHGACCLYDYIADGTCKDLDEAILLYDKKYAEHDDNKTVDAIDDLRNNLDRIRETEHRYYKELIAISDTVTPIVGTGFAEDLLHAPGTTDLRIAEFSVTELDRYLTEIRAELSGNE